MRLPRDISGMELVALLRRQYDYALVRQTGSHMRLVSYYRGYQGHVSVPNHSSVNIRTLARILNDVAVYLDVDREEVSEQLFGR